MKSKRQLSLSSLRFLFFYENGLSFWSVFHSIRHDLVFFFLVKDMILLNGVCLDELMKKFFKEAAKFDIMVGPTDVSTVDESNNEVDPVGVLAAKKGGNDDD